jgi:hypothetical protein
MFELSLRVIETTIYILLFLKYLKINLRCFEIVD